VHYRLLIVDDDPLNLDALTRVLGDEYDLVRASDGEEALRFLREQRTHIDLILSDKAMPRMSGVKLLEEAKALNPEIMRIILTAYPDAADLAEAINRGEVYRYVTKPWSPDEVRVVVAQALERYQLGRDNAELIDELKRKNAELKALATRVADAFLRRLDVVAPGTLATGDSKLTAVRDLMAAAAYPTVMRAARSMSRALERLRRRAAEHRAEAKDPTRIDLIDFFDIIARECIAEAQRILTVLEEIDELAQPERFTPVPEPKPTSPPSAEDDELEE
jgi:response regulator RpfG family c-di-GMP phosphodiesterase